MRKLNIDIRSQKYVLCLSIELFSERAGVLSRRTECSLLLNASRARIFLTWPLLAVGSNPFRRHYDGGDDI